jgi:uncharacterized protein
VSDAVADRRRGIPADLRFVAIGAYVGFVLLKSEVVSWYRIQEMFRFQSFHMYGVIGTAVLVAALTVWAVRRLRLRAVDGRPIAFETMPPGWRRYLGGGTLFGVGWALTGACPGPIAALVGAGLWPFTIVFASALFGTYAYGRVRARLPH